MKIEKMASKMLVLALGVSSTFTFGLKKCIFEKKCRNENRAAALGGDTKKRAPQQQWSRICRVLFFEGLNQIVGFRKIMKQTQLEMCIIFGKSPGGCGFEGTNNNIY